MMSEQDLKQSLVKLHDSLTATGHVDEELKALLKELDGDIRHLLDRDDTPDDPIFAGLRERSQALSARFAAQHPRLEPVLRELGEILERMGV
jgi:hypothetical protein